MSETNNWIEHEWLNAQAGCIGCVCVDPKLAGRLLAETTDDDFDGTGKLCYQAISALFNDGKSPDAVNIGEKLSGAYNDYLVKCIEIVPSAYSLDGYIEIVREKARMHRVQMILLQASYAPTMEALEADLSKANELMVAEKQTKAYTMNELVMDFYDRKRTAERYIQTGIRPLDAAMYLSSGDYVILAGRPSRGKTAMAIQMALAQSRQYRVGFYSLETSKGKVMDRIMCHYGKIPMSSIKAVNLDDEQWRQVAEAADAIVKHFKLEVIEAAGMSVDDIFHEAISRKHEIIYIDYLQIIRGDGKTRYDQVTNISVRLHQLAQKHHIMVVALSQLSRDAAAKANEEPDMSDLRESGQIEQDADAILMIYCQKKGATEGPRTIKIAKNKEGELAYLDMAWDGALQTLTPMSRRTPPAIPKTMRPLADSTPIPPEFEQTKIPQA